MCGCVLFVDMLLSVCGINTVLYSDFFLLLRANEVPYHGHIVDENLMVYEYFYAYFRTKVINLPSPFLKT